MLKKIFDFFLQYFKWIFSKKEPEETVVIQPDPDPEDAKPQDGSDVPADSTTVEVTTELEEIVSETDNQPAPPPVSSSRYLWCLDNGHGKLTPGKRSPKLSDGERLFEYEFNRDIVRRVIIQLKEQGIDYYNVVPEVDVDNFLKGRVLRANNHPSTKEKIYVSIHSNAGPAPTGQWATAEGIETWFFYGSRDGKKIATIFQKHLIGYTNWVNRGVKSRKSSQFYVLRQTAMPAVLTENGFFNNQVQVYELMKDEVRQKIADAHVAAITEIEKNGI